MRVRAELGRRGVGRPLAESILRETFPPDDMQALVERTAAVLRRRPAFQRAGDRRAQWLAMQLARRGFPHSAVRKAVSRHCSSEYGDDMIGQNVTE